MNFHFSYTQEELIMTKFASLLNKYLEIFIIFILVSNFFIQSNFIFAKDYNNKYFFKSINFEPVLPEHHLFQLQMQVFDVISYYWKVNDLFYKLSCNPTNENLLDEYNTISLQYQQKTINLASCLIKSLYTSFEQIEFVSSIYKSLDHAARLALFPTIDIIKSASINELKPILPPNKVDEYFPGYGYAEPGYKYRKGKEIGREYKGSQWQYEEQTLSTTWNVELVVTIDIVQILKNMLSSGAITNLNVGPQYEINMNGIPTLVCKVTFNRVKSLVTKINRKFDVNKVWFELWRAKYNGFTTGPWELCGKTYEIIYEPSGENVVTEIKIK